MLYSYDTENYSNQSACIHKHDGSKQELIDHMNEDYFEHSDFKVVDLEPLHFGDCWIKTFNPELFEVSEDEYEIDGIPCNITKPGRHPGLSNQYWLEPKETVYCPVLKEIDR